MPCARSPTCSRPTEAGDVDLGFVPSRTPSRARSTSPSTRSPSTHDLLIQREVVLAVEPEPAGLARHHARRHHRGAVDPDRHRAVPRLPAPQTCPAPSCGPPTPPPRRRARSAERGDPHDGGDRHRRWPPSSTGSTCSPPTSRTTPRTRPASSSSARDGIPAPTGHDKTSIVVFQRADRPGSLLVDPPGVRGPRAST